MRRRHGAAARRWAAIAAAVLPLAGCNALVAQNPPSSMRSVNAVRHGDDARLMLRGFDVVAYQTDKRAVPGSAQWRLVYEGVTYWFAAEANRSAFAAAPARWQPAYHGWDAMRMVFAIPDPADPQVFKLIDGRLFLFADAVSRAAFELDEAANIALADRYWQTEVLGRFSDVVRAQRSVDRVPHYKSRDELAREVAARAKPG